jgi:hypothetical protein
MSGTRTPAPSSQSGLSPPAAVFPLPYAADYIPQSSVTDKAML